MKLTPIECKGCGEIFQRPPGQASQWGKKCADEATDKAKAEFNMRTKGKLL